MRRRILSQNFLYSGKLVKELVRDSSIGKNDTVLEIGPGKGIITKELLGTARKVIAVELDTVLFSYLHRKFAEHKSKFELINKDFLHYKLPKKFPYKVCANIPFSIEGKIIRKLLNTLNPPEDCYLVTRRDLAERLIGQKKETQFSIFYKPWFDFEIVHYFNRRDFIPQATMDSVLLRFTKRRESLLTKEEKRAFIIFVGQGFGGGKRLKYNLRIFLSHEQFSRLSQILRFNIKSRPTDLSLWQWIELFKFTHKTGKII